VIVGQKQESVEKWLNKNPMPFPFLIDETREVIKQFDVYHPIGIDAFRIAHPSMFVVSSEGKIVYVQVGESQTDRPTDEQTMEVINNYL
jgi:peroxiredoxin